MSTTAGHLAAAHAPAQLPDGWRLVRLRDICQQDRRIIDGNSPEAQSLSYLGLEHVEANTGRILPQPQGPLEDTGISSTFRFDARHVLYGKLRPYLNKVALPESAGRCTTELIPLLPRDGVLREFLAWGLRRPQTVAAAMREKTGSRMPRANMDRLLATFIPLPPLAEQRRIVAVLSEKLAAVEKARAAAEERLRAAKALPGAFLRQLLPTFGRPMPAGWRLARLSDVCELNPRRPNLSSRADDAPTTFVPMQAVGEREGAIVAAELRPFREVANGYTYFAEGDVLFAKITPCMQNGKHAIARGLTDGIGFGSTEFHVIRPGPDIMAEWVWHYVRQPRVLRDATRYFTGAVGQQRVPDDFLARLRIPLPALDEQQRIVEILTSKLAAVEKARAATEAQLRALESLSPSFSARAFAGGL